MNKKDIPSIIDLVVDGAKAIIISSQGSFEDYINKRALELDSYIKLQESEESLTYVAGEVQISIDDKEDCFFLLAEFYFKNINEQWVKKTIKGESLKINWVFTSEFEKLLKDKKKISFDYERP